MERMFCVVMKRTYETPNVSIINFENEDIVTTSTNSLVNLTSLGENDIAWDLLGNNQ